MFSLGELILLEKLGRDNGWDLVQREVDGCLTFSSARHGECLALYSGEDPGSCFLRAGSRFASDLQRKFSLNRQNDGFSLPDRDRLGPVLRRLTELSLSLPDTPLEAFERDVEAEIREKGLADSERIAQVKQRVGQEHYRQAQLEYWQGRCAVTGIALEPVLRASHARPWAMCERYEQRLSVFNGFLLSANFDSLFDKGFISFDDEGLILISTNISKDNQKLIGLSSQLRLRWIEEEHIPFLQWHRNNLYNK